MNKFNHKCPFCRKDIPKIYETKTITKVKRHKVRTKTFKEIVGEDWTTHANQCNALKDFLKNTKI